MAGFNGSGTYVRPFSWQNDKANGIDITASRFDTDGNDVATALSTCICKDGQQTTTARIPFAVGLSFAGASGVVPTGDLTTGMFQTGSSGEVDFYSVGTQVATINANGLDNTIIGAGTPKAGSFTSITGTSISGITAFNKVTLTAPATGSTITIADGKTLTVDNTLEFAGTDSTVMTFPSSSGTVVTLAATQTLTNKTLTTAALGSSTATTQTAADSSTKVATTAFVNGTALTLATGTTAVTQSAADNSTKVATTAYADNAAKTLSGITLLTTVNASATAAASFTAKIDNTHNKYMIHFDSVYFSGASSTFGIEISTDGGSTWKSTGYLNSQGAVTTYGDICNGNLPTSTSTEPSQGRVEFANPAAAQKQTFIYATNVYNGSNQFKHAEGGFSYDTSGAINAVRLRDTTAGNSITGNFHLYGIAGT